MSTARNRKDTNYILVAGYCRTESNDMNIIDAIISIIFEYQRVAKWSNKYKGDKINLLENDSKAICTDDNVEGEFHSIRADFCIARNQIVSWELEAITKTSNCYFYGVVSSEVTNFNQCPAGSMSDAYGVDDSADCVYNGGGQTWLKWSKPFFLSGKVFIIKIIADWTGKQCKLTFYYNGKKLNDSNDDYTMIVPKLEDNVVLYPCVTPCNPHSYCIIRYV